MKNKIFLITLGILAIIGILSTGKGSFFVATKKLPTAPSPSVHSSSISPSADKKTGTIVVSQKIANSLAGQYTLPSNSTVLALLQSSAMIEQSGQGKMAFITAINGRKADDTKKEFWALYVNQKKAEVGAGSYQLKSGDEVEWKIETY